MTPPTNDERSKRLRQVLTFLNRLSGPAAVVIAIFAYNRPSLHEQNEENFHKDEGLRAKAATLRAYKESLAKQVDDMAQASAKFDEDIADAKKDEEARSRATRVLTSKRDYFVSQSIETVHIIESSPKDLPGETATIAPIIYTVIANNCLDALDTKRADEYYTKAVQASTADGPDSASPEVRLFALRGLAQYYFDLPQPDPKEGEAYFTQSIDALKGVNVQIASAYRGDVYLELARGESQVGRIAQARAAIKNAATEYDKLFPGDINRTRGDREVAEFLSELKK